MLWFGVCVWDCERVNEDIRERSRKMVTLVSTLHSYIGIISILSAILEPLALILAILCMIKYLRN